MTDRGKQEYSTSAKVNTEQTLAFEQIEDTSRNYEDPIKRSRSQTKKSNMAYNKYAKNWLADQQHNTHLAESQYVFFMNKIEEITKKTQPMILDLFQSAGNKDKTTPEDLECMKCKRLIFEPKKCNYCNSIICSHCTENL